MKKRVCILTIVVAFLLLLLAVKLAMPNKVYRYEGTAAFSAETQVQETILFQGISLPVGSYRVELSYNAGKDLGMWCNVKDGTVFTGALLCNGEHLYSALEKTGYDMWLYESTENLQVYVSGQGPLETGDLQITETNLLWTMLMTLVVFGALLGYAIIFFCNYDKTHGISREKKQIFFFVTVIAFLASLPYLYGWNITGADLTYHLQRIEGVKDGLMTGQFPVRLEPKWLYGHGYANGIFYCNTFLYLPALLRLLGFTITASYNVYCISFNLATAWIAYYCFSRMFGKHTIGVLCSALYTLSIFRIYKLVITTAVGEGSAVTFIPLVLYGLYRIFTEDPCEKGYKTSWVPLMLGYAGLIQTHVLTCEITAIVTIVFCLMHLRKFLCKNVWVEFIKAAAGAVALSLWYLVPFLDYYLTQDMHIKNVSARTIQDRGLLFAQIVHHFWKVDGEQKLHPVGVGFVLAAALGIFLILWFTGIFREKSEKTLFVKKTSLVGVMLILMSLNIFPWDKIQKLHPIAASLVSSLQFPNRFLGWGTVCLIFVFGFLMKHFLEKEVRFYWAAVAAAIFALTTSSMYLLDFVKAEQVYFELYNEESMGFGYISGAEYVIEGTDDSLLSFANPSGSSQVTFEEYEKNGLKATFICRNAGAAEGYLDLPMLLYKGYQAYDSHTGEKLDICYGENYVIRVLLPAGHEGAVTVRFKSPFYWRVAEIITWSAGVVLLVIWIKYKRKNYVETEIK